MGALILAVLMSGFVIIIMVITLGAVVWGSVMQPKRQGQKWGRAARALGLTLEPYEAGRHRLGFHKQPPSHLQVMRGTQSGLPFRIGVRRVVTGSGKNRSVTHYTYVAVDFPRSLNMGLQMRGRGAVQRFFEEATLQADIPLGDPRLDKPYTVRGADADHVRALLRVPYLADALAAIVGRAFKLQVHDGGLKLEARAFLPHADQLRVVLDTAVDLAHRFGSARAQIGESNSQQHVEAALRTVAQRHDLQYDAAQTMVSGRLEGMYVEADAVFAKASQGHIRHTRFAVRFDRALGIRLELKPQGSLHGIARALGMQDIETGDAAFDRRFVVQGQPVDAVRAVLTPDVRTRLAALQDQSVALTVKDDLIEAHAGYPMFDATQLEAGLFAMARVGAALAQVQHRPVGPFRG